MSVIRRTGVLLVVLVAGGTAALSQPPGPPPGFGGDSGPAINVKKFEAARELARLTKKYKLTPEEQGKIRPILEQQQKQVHALGEDQSLSDAEWVAAVRRVHRQTVAKVKEQLTDEQASRYGADEDKQAKDDAEADADQGPPNGPPPDGGPPPGGGGPM